LEPFSLDFLHHLPHLSFCFIKRAKQALGVCASSSLTLSLSLSLSLSHFVFVLILATTHSKITHILLFVFVPYRLLSLSPTHQVHGFPLQNRKMKALFGLE